MKYFYLALGIEVVIMVFDVWVVKMSFWLL